MKDRTLLFIATLTKGFASVCLFVAAAGTLLRQPELNLFLETDDLARVLRFCGVVFAIGAGAVSLTPWRKAASIAPFAFFNFVFGASIFGVVATHLVFAKVLVGALFASMTIGHVCTSRGLLESVVPSIRPGAEA